MNHVRLAISIGDINGIGLECLIKAMPHVTSRVALTLCCNEQTLITALAAHSLEANVENGRLIAGGYPVEICTLPAEVNVTPGALDTQSGVHAVASLESAYNLVSSDTVHGIVTLPLSKDICARAGFTYPGQTEYFEAKTGVRGVMVLCSNGIRVALATIHVPLRRVADALTAEGIEQVVRVFVEHLRTDSGVAAPRVAVLGLNPHAGEHGRLGSEEDVLIRPAIERLIVEGYNVDGPHAADGFFAFGDYRRYDGVVAMYHDQGLIPLKLLAGGGGVNCTVGLPIVRTSPDHGTAFGIAGKGLADGRSTQEAITLAADFVQRRRKLR
jgi:4-hydroxythreonine-4-phosphate dehydrogenase